MVKKLLRELNLFQNCSVTDVAFMVGSIFATILVFPSIVEYANWVVGFCAIICFFWRQVIAALWPGSDT